MPPATVTPQINPMLGREKKFSPGSPARKGGNPLTIILLLMVGVLVVAGGARMFSKPAASVEKLQVVAAATDLPPGTRLGITNLHYLTIPRKYHSPDMAVSYEELVGFTTRNYLPQGEPILRSDLFPRKGAVVARELAANQRAMTLKLDEDTLVDHAIVPGDTVDVLCTSTAHGKKVTSTICQSVPVLISMPRAAMLSQKMTSAERNRITLALTPEQCERVAQATEVGKVRLVLSNNLVAGKNALAGVGDSDIQPKAAKSNNNAASTVPAAVATLPPPPPPLPAALPPPAVHSTDLTRKWNVEVFRGACKYIYEIPCK